MKAGELLILETGEYSDYTFHGPFTVVCDFDIAEQAEHFKETNKDKYYVDLYAFIAFLSKVGFIVDLDCKSVHIGSYGRLKVKL